MEKILLGIYEHLQLQRNSCVGHHKSGGSGDGRATLSCVAAEVVAMFVLSLSWIFLLAVVSGVPGVVVVTIGVGAFLNLSIFTL